MPLTAVFSGPLATRELASAKLAEAQFSIDERHGDHHWGHPSYRNPTEAAQAGKPNAGHTPGAGHPDTDQPYAPDRRISFLTATNPTEDRQLASALLGAAGTVLEPTGWVLRSHWHKELVVLTPEQVVELRGLKAKLDFGNIVR